MIRRLLGLTTIFLFLLLPACAAPAAEPATDGAAAADAAGSVAAEETEPADTPAEEPAPSDDGAETSAESEVAPDATTTPATPSDLPRRLATVARSWNTDWSQTTIDLNELLSGGPPRDGIPPIDDPQYVSPEEAADWLAGREPVIALEIDGDARAYPLQIMTWHEIVNTEVGGTPVAVTFCPLCNAAIVFDRRLDGTLYDFGTSGLLRNSDLVMWDRQTESLWQQFTGQGIVGELAGEQLTFIPASIISFDNFVEAYPEGQVLSRNTGFNRQYGMNPYPGYDDIDSSPFLFTGVTDGRLAAMARVVAVEIDDQFIAYPLETLAEMEVINDTFAGQELVVFHLPGTASALGAGVIADAEDVGATGVFSRVVDGQTLTFRAVDGRFVDEESGTTWNIVGEAVEGPLAGTTLEQLVSADHFWFAWAAFRPDTEIYQPE
jgi:hypothetical protein